MSTHLTLLALVLVFGYPVQRALRDPRGMSGVEVLGRALAFGLGGLGACSLLVDGLGLGVSRLSVGAAAGVVLAIALGRLARRRRAAVRRPAGPALLPGGKGPRVLTLLLLALTAGALLMVLHQGLVRPVLQFDALTRWMLKAKALFYDGTLLGRLSTDPEYAFTHQRYPPLVSYVANLSALVSRRFDDRIASSIFPWFSVALACVLHGTLARRVGALAAALGAAWFATLPLVWFLVTPPAGASAASAMADIPLALFGALAAFVACDRLDDARGGGLELGLALALTMLCKNEGLSLALAILLGMAAARPRRWRLLLSAGLVAALGYTLLWGRIAAGLPALDENYPHQMRLDVLLAGFARLKLILPELGAHLVDFHVWNLTWPALLGLTLLGAARLLRPPARLLLVALLLQAGAYLLAYMITAWTSPKAEQLIAKGGDPVVVLVSRSVDRLLLHLFPLALTLALMVSRPGEPQDTGAELSDAIRRNPPPFGKPSA